MAHHFAVSILLYLLHGAATILPDTHLGPEVYASLVKWKGTVLYAAPFHYAMLSALPEARPVPSLRLAVSTAVSLPRTTAEDFAAKFQVPLRQGMGVIECGLPLFNDRWPEKMESIGAPQDGYACELRDPSGARAVEGEPGALFVKGPGFVDAYLSPWMEREKILENGWFRTGDQARIDEDGAVFLVGRTHSVINVGGMKCFPEEVEACLCEHPAVKEARVTAIAHHSFGMAPAAEIVPVNSDAPPSAAELIAHCRARLSGYKVPLKFAFLTLLPKTKTGKLDRLAPFHSASAPS
jgi:long-chain acyl-CoA synthetase